MTNADCIAFLQWALPRMQLSWSGFRKVRRSVCKRIDRRCRELRLHDLAEYRVHLEIEPPEWDVLWACCAIPITYFSSELQMRLARELIGRLQPRGALVIGLHESLPSGAAGMEAWPNARAVLRRAGLSESAPASSAGELLWEEA